MASSKYTLPHLAHLSIRPDTLGEGGGRTTSKARRSVHRVRRDNEPRRQRVRLSHPLLPRLYAQRRGNLGADQGAANSRCALKYFEMLTLAHISSST